MQFLITGGAGFIGSALIRWLIQHTEHDIINVDKLTYAGNLCALYSVETHPRYHFEQTDICDGQMMAHILSQYRPDAAIHLAAESHVDRSIDAPAAFMQTNIIGTYTLLEAARNYYEKLTAEKKRNFVFYIFLPMKCMAMWRKITPYPRKMLRMRQVVRIPLQKPLPIIWLTLGTALMACR